MSRRVYVLLLNSVLLGACDPRATPDYIGEPIVTLHGSVVSTLVDPPPLEVALTWVLNSSGELLASAARIEGEFPQAFVLDLYAPPDPQDDYFPGLAIAKVSAWRRGASAEELSPYDVFGVSDAALVFVRDTFDAGGLELGRFDVNGLLPGFQIRRPRTDVSGGTESVPTNTAIALEIRDPADIDADALPGTVN